MKKLLASLLTAAAVAFAAPAFAANPFADIPAGHWTYDAVAQLAAHGIVSGYPDGAFKGKQPATRYEVASVVARALAKAEEGHASKQDLEVLKKLVMEFNDELSALGVKADKLDKRVTLIEERLGGWNLSGTFAFEAAFGGDKQRYMNVPGSNTQFRKEQFYLYLSKQIDENTSFFAEYLHGADDTKNPYGGMGELGEGGLWRCVYVDTNLPYDVGLSIGRFEINFEEDYGLFNDDEPIFGHYYTDGFRLAKTWNNLRATAAVGRNQSYNYDYNDMDYTSMNYVLDLNWQPSEKFFAGATGYWKADDSQPSSGDLGVSTYGVYAGYNFTPNVALKGIYYFQQLGADVAGGYDDSPSAWKVMLDVKQDLLKYTSLWLEYDNQHNNFWKAHNERFGIGGSACPTLLDNLPTNNNHTSAYFVRAEQEWSKKWSTLLRYGRADFNTAGYDDPTLFEFAVTYRHSPALAFTLLYDQVDYGTNSINNIKPDTAMDGKDHVILFRTVVDF
ncbi:MAG: S-layer homology domain-containing protein [Synergistaceae bacterium]|nr:S-layer homology domain-containing protein [Synergistaceae bacterium]